jgi:hypothetical protein
VTRHPYLLGMGLAVAIFGAMLFVGIWLPGVASSLSLHAQWSFFASYTFVLFGITLYYWWDDANAAFWIILTSLLILHIAGFVLLLNPLGFFGPLAYAVIGPFEVVILWAGLFGGMQLARRFRRVAQTRGGSKT